MPEGLGLPAWWPHRARSSVIEAGNLGWHVQTFGKDDGFGPTPRPVALLLHGTGSGCHSWRHLAPLLGSRYHVVAPDLPGHARTRTPDSQALNLAAVSAALGDLLASLSLRPTLVLAHSAGAAVAIRMALDGRIAPDLIASINGAILPLQGAVERAFLPLAKLMAATAWAPRAFAAWSALPRTTHRLLESTGSRIDGLGERCYAHLLRDPRSVAGALRLMASWDLPSLAPALSGLRRRCCWSVAPTLPDAGAVARCARGQDHRRREGGDPAAPGPPGP